MPGGSGLPRGAMSSQNVAPWDDRVSAGEWGVPVGLPVHGVDWDAVLAQSPARWVDGTGPVPPGVLRRLACDSTIGRVVFGPDSQILNVGRRERTVTGARRQAVIARDRRCVWPTCDAPPSRCEVHHAATHWSQGGETSTDNSALLCWYHHDHVDTHGLTMWRLDGRWHITTPDGRTITDRPPATISYGAPGSTPHTAA